MWFSAPSRQQISKHYMDYYFIMTRLISPKASRCVCQQETTKLVDWPIGWLSYDLEQLAWLRDPSRLQLGPERHVVQRDLKGSSWNQLKRPKQFCYKIKKEKRKALAKKRLQHSNMSFREISKAQHKYLYRYQFRERSWTTNNLGWKAWHIQLNQWTELTLKNRTEKNFS